MEYMIKADQITSCYIGPKISPEQFIAEHVFMYLVKGAINGYDGNQHYGMQSGNCCLLRKNNLIRYNKQKENNQFEKVVIVLDEVFLKQFQQKHHSRVRKQMVNEAFYGINKSDLITNFLQSLSPYYNGAGEITAAFADLKREELLLILLQINPELENILFDFGVPEKIDLEAFMNRNFRFNAAIQRFAFLTGRSLTVFKEDFKRIFNESPGRWLVQKRLKEAYFLMDKKQLKATEVYLEVGFEDLSHFSFAFKKLFGFPPTQLSVQKRPAVLAN